MYLYLFKISICCFFILGINPINAYSSFFLGNNVKNVVTAQAPGIDVILMSFFNNSSINEHPGSEMQGVPASDTSAMFFPSLIREIIFLLRSFSLNL